MSVNRVRVIWGGSAAAGGGLSTFYFDPASGTTAQQIGAVHTFLGSTEDRRSTAATWASVGVVDTLNQTTGELEATSSVTPSSGVGTVAGDIMPSANQGLLRLLTGVIVSGRQLRGRIFLPGTCESDNTGGAPSSTYRTDYDAAGAALIADANTNWVAWSQTHGPIAPVSAVSTWTSWAVLRSRRDA